MITLIFGIACALLGLGFMVLQKTYAHVPTKELKRMARHDDPIAVLLYKPVAYGASLQVVLWFIVGLALAGSVVLFARTLTAWEALLVTVAIIWIGFVWIPASNLGKFGVWLARQVAPPLAWLLERLHPLTSRIIGFVRRHRPITVHTGLYQKSDLAELLEAQKQQPDSRIEDGEIDLLIHALSFGDKLVSDVLIPKRVVTLVSASEPIGPILMEELHKSGHSRFPVYDGKKDNIVGILHLRDLIGTRKTGTVSNLMKQHLSFVHEDFTLYQTLQAFISTKQHLFLVVNSFEEFVGIITIEDVLEQMVGKVIMDEFDQYDDLRAVAARAAQKEHESHEADKSEPELEPETTTSSPEVVE